MMVRGIGTAAAALGVLASTVVPTSAASTVTAAPQCIHPGASSPPVPTSDPFYAPPSPLPAGAPGTVLASRPVCLAGLYIGLPYQAWQVMYLSTGTEDASGNPSSLHAAPAVDIATIIEPLTPATTSPRPLVSYQSAEDADSQLSAPSYTMRQEPGTADTASVLPLLAAGIAVVVPDYEGLASEYGAAVQAAHAVLDGIRAAEHFAPAGLGGSPSAPTPVGLWGYSGGAIATGSAAELAATYAPELHIVGVAEGGVPADLEAVFDNLNGGPFAYLALSAAAGVDAAFDNLFYDEQPNPGNGGVGGPGITGFATVANPAGQALAADYRRGVDNTPANANIASYTWCRCNPLDRPAEFPGIAQSLAFDSPGQPDRVPNAPTYIYQAYLDELVPFAGVAKLVNTYCGEGVHVAFRVDYASEHISAAVTGAPGAIAYLTARFAGAPAPTTCGLPNNGGPPINPPIDPGTIAKYF